MRKDRRSRRGARPRLQWHAFEFPSGSFSFASSATNAPQGAEPPREVPEAYGGLNMAELVRRNMRRCDIRAHKVVSITRGGAGHARIKRITLLYSRDARQP